MSSGLKDSTRAAQLLQSLPSLGRSPCVYDSSAFPVACKSNGALMI